MRDQGDSGEEVASTPYHSKVYTDTPATRSPVLTVLLAIVILAILTGVALAILNWVQRRSTQLHLEAPAYQVATGNAAPRVVVHIDVVVSSLDIWKADYEQVLQ